MIEVPGAIVVGGGHNGLVCAAYLARAGIRPLVLERRSVIGGAVVTESPWGDGFKVSSLSYALGLMPSRIIRDLGLVERGLRVLPRGPLFLADEDGGSLTLWDDPVQRHAEVSRYSTRDADALPRYEAWLSGIADTVRELLWVTPPRLGSTRPRDLVDQLRFGWGLRGVGARGVADLTRIISTSVGDLLDEWFETDRLKAALAIQGVAGVWAGPYEPGSSYGLLHTSLGSGGEDAGLVSFGHVEGGMGSVTQSLAHAVVEAGGTVRASAPVTRLLTDGDTVVGVRLEDGTELRAPIVVSAIHPRLTFLELMDPEALPVGLAASIGRFSSRGGCIKINLALDGLPQFRALPGPDERPQHTGAIELASSLHHLQDGFDQARAGQPSSAPYADLNIVPSGDRTMAPDGMRIANILAQWVPASWSDEPYDTELTAFAESVIDAYTALAPDFRDRIVHRQIIGPYQLEHEYGLVGGSTFVGDLALHQLFHMRPAPEAADYRTPIRGLYLCGAGSHPGGGVSGIPGHNAAREIVRDTRGSRWRRGPLARSA